MLVLAIGIFLLVLSFATKRQNLIQTFLTDISTPFYLLSDMPTTVSRWVNRVITSSDDLHLSKQQLEAEALVLKGKLQRLNALSIENVRLRELLNSVPKTAGKILLADVIAVSPNPGYHYVMINRGASESVYVGQPAIDQNGLYGQVVEVGTETSRILLISDQHHAVPAEVSRNGLRVVVEGTSRYHRMNIPNIAPTSDIQEGDVLVTSGLGGIFPRGYPVAQVEKAILEKGSDYLSISASPLAQLDYSRHLLLLFER